MAWSPVQRVNAGLVRVEAPGDYATLNSNQLRDGTTESNGMSEDFVKTLKRDYVRISPLPDAKTALRQIAGWIEDCNEIHPHSALRMRSPREFIRAQAQQPACPVKQGALQPCLLLKVGSTESYMWSMVGEVGYLGILATSPNGWPLKEFTAIVRAPIKTVR